jgi:hypothetical protein
VGQVAAGWSGGLRSRCPPTGRPRAEYTWVTAARSRPEGGRCTMLCSAPRPPCGQLPAHLGDEEVPPVAAYVSEQRGNEPKRLRDLLCAGARKPREATSDTESWWINVNNDWRHASEGLRDSYERLGVTSQCRCRSTLSSHSPATSMVRVHLQLPAPGQQTGTTSAQSYDGER